MKHSIWPVLLCLAIIWAVGIYVEDSWLRPWNRVFSYSGGYSAAVILVWWLGSRYRVAALVLVMLTSILIIPAPSFRRSLLVENRTASPVVVKISDAEGHRRKQARLDAHEKWALVYFSGDHGREQVMPVLVKVRDQVSNRLGVQRIDLPLDTVCPDLIISLEWWGDHTKTEDVDEKL